MRVRIETLNRDIKAEQIVEHPNDVLALVLVGEIVKGLLLIDCDQIVITPEPEGGEQDER